MADAVLTHSSEYYKERYSRKTSLMKEYKANMMVFLRHRFPTTSIDKLTSILNNIVRTQYESRELKYLKSPSCCNIEVKSGDLLEITNEMNEDIISPYGVTYVQVAERKAVFSDFIEDKQGERKVVKKDMFLADAAGDTNTVKMKDLKQRNIKIDINVLSGVMLSTVTFRSAINYNAITATSRFSIMTAYATVELAMSSNYYFHSEDRAINWIINLLRIMPSEDVLSQCLADYNIAIPSVEKVFEAYQEQVNNYSTLCKGIELQKILSSLSPLELAFVYYGVNIKRIFQDNEYFRHFFGTMLDLSKVPLYEGEIPKLARPKDGIIHTFAVIMHSSDIGKLTMEHIDEHDPIIARKLYSTYLYLEEQLKSLESLFDTLVLLPICPTDITVHKNMIRRTVLLSDTDSILFTNVAWIKWYFSDIAITEASKNFNAAIVTIISKFLEHVFGYMSACMNIGVDQIKTIAIKNEFMYDLFLRTPISKHYAGYVSYREGVHQNPYKFDLKGKNFRGSDLCKETTTYAKWLIRYIFDNFLKTYTLDAEDMITKVIIFEQRIKQSIAHGEVTFLTQKPIQLKQNYAKPESSNYLYYELWTEVFSEKYGELNLPQKTKELPIYRITLKDHHHLHHIKAIDKDIYDKFIDFIKKYPKKEFLRVLIPMDGGIPEELKAIANYRKVCSLNCYSLNLILKSFNLNNYPGTKKDIVLFSDTYPYLLQEITDADQERARKEAAEYVDDELEWYEEDSDDEDDDDWSEDEEEGY